MKPVLGQAPLFPLPHGALLPGELLPLHIFEARYRQMLEDVRRGTGLIAIATLLPGWELSVHGNPPIADTVGVGRVVKDRQKPDGTSDIVLHGLVRAEILEEAPSHPYRKASFAIHPHNEVHPATSYRQRRRLLSGLAARVPGLRCDVTASFEAGALADRIAGLLRLAPEERVAMLQALDPTPRIDALLDLLEEDEHRERLPAIIPTLSDFALYLEDATP